MVLRTSSTSDYASFVNPQWQRLLSILGMNVCYERCLGAELFTSGGERIVDFLSGYCVHNTGHNHPEIVAAIKRKGRDFPRRHIREELRRPKAGSVSV